MKGKTTNELIQKGAKLTTDISDILNTYKNINFQKRQPINNNFNIDIPQELLKIYKEINNNPIGINELVRKTGLTISEINYKTMLLQIENKIIELPGQRFIRNNEDN